MNEKDFAPLTAACVRALNDKLYEKRKGAALEIERQVREYVATNNREEITRVLQVLGGKDFSTSQNPNGRKGGLIGMAATAIALGKESSLYVREMVKPTLACFYDQDGRVRYYACEALYNIVKVARGSVLPLFNDIFDGLSKLAADPDQNVKNGSELLDRLVKDIVTESSSFDLVSFMPLLRDRIYVRNAFARQFLVSWISTLDAVPDIEMIVFLPEILDGLFNILGDENDEIRKMCEACLGEFLQGIHKERSKADFAAMANVLVMHSQSKDPLIQHTALLWLKDFLQLSGRVILPYASGIITAVLPCLAYDASRKNTLEVAKIVNSNMISLIAAEADAGAQSAEQKVHSTGGKDEVKEGTKSETESAATKVATRTGKVQGVSDDLLLDVGAVVRVLMKYLSHEAIATREASLRWIYHLLQKTPEKMFCFVDDFFPLLMKTLSDPSDEVVLLDLEVLTEVSSNPAGNNITLNYEEMGLPSQAKVTKPTGLSAYFVKFMVILLDSFNKDKQLLEDRGSFIIRQLCLMLNAEAIYRSFSEILLHENDLRFACHMVQTLNIILLTSTELFDLRNLLKDLKNEESCSLFCCLYHTWCHSPVATVSLCFLTQNYEHASNVLLLFGDVEVTVEFLAEIDKLVQLIESPIFTYLRLQLLDPQLNQSLITSLYALLMLLPQGDAFRTLRHRLECVPSFQYQVEKKTISGTKSKKTTKSIDFKKLLEIFRDTQEKHRMSKKTTRRKETARQLKIDKV
ncbi:protein VAC14 homolog isoform X4 [Lingula anatina]|uniref:Protein VAC14 homolog n=1 Tax=Lingula anatina TaxID=7574 RepID=A0A1S3H7G1_LINAN|nr:protein VAC14 homolog isoform X3 [Lingula anatina]XP_013381426.1 protein VAC14 homolog isoform X4 [Lingula anatina]|eukprot:XP_013381425.1 protein VAC14 homolog isoform X3 [Lingula anatina]